MSADVISPETHFALWKRAGEYSRVIQHPQFSLVGRFATKYTGTEIPERQTLITTNKMSLDVSDLCDDPTAHFFVSVDVLPESPPAIVEPDIKNGTPIRRHVRYLTEPEGIALVEDLDQLLAEAV